MVRHGRILVPVLQNLLSTSPPADRQTVERIKGAPVASMMMNPNHASQRSIPLAEVAFARTAHPMRDVRKGTMSNRDHHQAIGDHMD
jgi:hypothetical protein